MPKFTHQLENGQIEAKHTDRQIALRWMGKGKCA
jgi:hypothetical protein